jgi:hypothetical protein
MMIDSYPDAVRVGCHAHYLSWAIRLTDNEGARACLVVRRREIIAALVAWRIKFNRISERRNTA